MKSAYTLTKLVGVPSEKYPHDPYLELVSLIRSESFANLAERQLQSTIMSPLASPRISLGSLRASAKLIAKSRGVSSCESIIASLVLAVFTVLAFGWGLKLQLPVWPVFFE